MNAVHVRNQKHELTPPRNSNTEDALPRSEFQPRLLPGQDPLSRPRHPLCHPVQAGNVFSSSVGGCSVDGLSVLHLPGLSCTHLPVSELVWASAVSVWRLPELIRGNGSCPGRYLGWSSEFGRASCCVTGLSLSPVTVCLACTQYTSAEKLSPFYYRCRKNIFLTRQTVVASS
ncbi:hypothetical protein V6N12_050368 [Hibiscus sabdariffa]|uniref:Uncharacterized protein n=1 Tax=Hibiscus sabdariffa TaxID=183260 RepID=A0ABR2GCN0_9ROSI